jgi:pSer/pThr/pTyr-binding forkhead associated (FHA) protein
LIQIARDYWAHPDAFERAHPHPWLLWTVTSPLGSASSTVTTSSRGNAGRKATLSDPLLFPVAKRAGASPNPDVTLGRTETNDIVVSDVEVSRLHAVLRHRDAWFVIDTNSKNGTWLNGNPVAPGTEQPLGEESKLSIGGLEMQFFMPQRLMAFLSRLAPPAR